MWDWFPSTLRKKDESTRPIQLQDNGYKHRSGFGIVSKRTWCLSWRGNFTAFHNGRVQHCAQSRNSELIHEVSVAQIRSPTSSLLISILLLSSTYIISTVKDRARNWPYQPISSSAVFKMFCGCEVTRTSFWEATLEDEATRFLVASNVASYSYNLR